MIRHLNLNQSTLHSTSTMEGVSSTVFSRSHCRINMKDTPNVANFNIIGFPKVRNESATLSTASHSHMQSDSEVSGDNKPGAAILQTIACFGREELDEPDKFCHVQQFEGLEQKFHCTYFLELRVLEELQTQLDFEEQLLTDLVTEALCDIYDGSDAYWPKELCVNCHIQPPSPTEHHVLRKVQSRIQKLETFSLEASDIKNSLNAYELAESAGWMNLQAEAESLALAIEDMIFDELIDELINERARDERF